MNPKNKELNLLTKESLALAACKYITDRSASTLTVKELCNIAGVSRNAFYRNFSDIAEVLQYYLIIRWTQFADKIGLTEDMKDRQGPALLQFMYSEQEFIRALKNKQMLYLLEELFVRIILEGSPDSVNTYASYSIAYSIYGFIRAMVDRDFSETPEEILKMFP